MNKYLKIILKWLGIFFVMSIIIFALVRMMPGSPEEITLSHLGLPPTEENIAAIRHEYGMDKPLITQYFSWMGDFVKGEWGKSYLTNTSLTHEMLSRAPLTMAISLGGIIIAMGTAFFIGYRASIKEGGAFDRLSKILALGTQTIPVFLVILVVIYIIGVKFRLVKFFTEVSAVSVIFAMIFVAMPMIGMLSRTVRSHFKETANMPFMQYYKARGYEFSKALLKYGSPKAIYGLMAVSISSFSGVIGGATIVEFSMAIPGLSVFLIESLSRRDYPMIQSYILIMIVWMFMVNIIFEFFMDKILKREEWER